MMLNKTFHILDHNSLDVHITDDEGWTALHYSARCGSYENVKFFADAGTDINLKTNDGMNCFHIAADYCHLNLCKTLINRHSFDSRVDSNDGWTALHYSARNGSYELVKYFANIGNLINLKTNSGWNCLHIAAFYGHFTLCKTLINNHNFDVNIASNDGWTALHYSARHGSYELVSFFSDEGTDINLKTYDGRNCFHIAADYGHLTLCKTLINKHNFNVQIANNDGWTALHYSAKNGSCEFVNFLCDVGTDINLKTYDGRNCFHIAADYGHLTLCKTLINKHNFDLQLADKDGWTALHYSARNGTYELVKFFADMGTDVNLKINLGWNCLHIAALYGHLNLCKKLINKHNFDAQIVNNDGWTGLHFPARSGSYELVKFFAVLGTDINLKTNLGWNVFILQHYTDI